MRRVVIGTDRPAARLIVRTGAAAATFLAPSSVRPFFFDTPSNAGPAAATAAIPSNASERKILLFNVMMDTLGR
jgi:hypothetical protein